MQHFIAFALLGFAACSGGNSNMPPDAPAHATPDSHPPPPDAPNACDPGDPTSCAGETGSPGP